MARSMHSSSLFLGLVTARSVEVPSDAALIFYSVQVEEEDGVVVYDNIVPQDHYRLSSVFDMDLIPFKVGQELLIGISRAGATDSVFIMSGELPNAGPCT